jgi:protein required for attachment to host cells
MMRKVWIVVANGSQAKIYRAENVHTLVEVAQFAHEQSHLDARDLVSDKPGRATSRQYSGTHTYSDSNPKLQEKNIFAEQVARFLEEGLNSGSYERLYLISNAQFGAMIREHVNGPVSKAIYSEIHKDLTHISPSEILTYLPPVL